MDGIIKEVSSWVVDYGMGLIFAVTVCPPVFSVMVKKPIFWGWQQLHYLVTMQWKRIEW